MISKSVYRWGFLLAFFCFVSPFLKAQDENEDDSPKFIYILELDEDELFHMVPMLQKGRFLGKFTTQDSLDQGGLKLNNLGLFFQSYAELNQKTADDLKKAVESGTKDLKSTSLSQASSEHNAPMAHEVPELNLTEFKACAEKSHKLLRKIQFFEYRKELDMAQLLHGQLDMERGNGAEISAAGTICGAYLGPLGTAKQKLLDELKFILVAKDLEMESLKNFLRAFVVLFHVQDQAMNKVIWKHLYLKMALMRIQNPQLNLPDLPTMFQKFLDSLPEAKEEIEETPLGQRGATRLRITKVWDKKALQEAFDQGMSYANKLLP